MTPYYIAVLFLGKAIPDWVAAMSWDFQYPVI